MVTIKNGTNLAGLYSAGGSFTDANSGTDEFSATVNYGDGQGAQPLKLSGSTFTLSHQYAVPLLGGSFKVTVTITDETEGLSGKASKTVTFGPLGL